MKEASLFLGLESLMHLPIISHAMQNQWGESMSHLVLQAAEHLSFPFLWGTLASLFHTWSAMYFLEQRKRQNWFYNLECTTFKNLDESQEMPQVELPYFRD